jgi:biotin carboxyl carrier protein
MGQDRSHPPFREALLKLLHDQEPMVRRNAALGLAAFGEPVARPELLAMLRTHTVPAPAGGAVRYRLKVGDYVNPGTLIGHVGEVEARAAVPGEVRSLALRDGAEVSRGEPLAELGPDKNHVWEALRALYIVGAPEDADAVERYTRPIGNIPETVARQASLTLQEIRARAAGR